MSDFNFVGLARSPPRGLRAGYWDNTPAAGKENRNVDAQWMRRGTVTHEPKAPLLPKSTNSPNLKRLPATAPAKDVDSVYNVTMGRTLTFEPGSGDKQQSYRRPLGTTPGTAQSDRRASTGPRSHMNTRTPETPLGPPLSPTDRRGQFLYQDTPTDAVFSPIPESSPRGSETYSVDSPEQQTPALAQMRHMASTGGRRGVELRRQPVMPTPMLGSYPAYRTATPANTPATPSDAMGLTPAGTSSAHQLLHRIAQRQYGRHTTPPTPAVATAANVLAQMAASQVPTPYSSVRNPASTVRVNGGHAQDMHRGHRNGNGRRLEAALEGAQDTRDPQQEQASDRSEQEQENATESPQAPQSPARERRAPRTPATARERTAGSDTPGAAAALIHLAKGTPRTLIRGLMDSRSQEGRASADHASTTRRKPQPPRRTAPLATVSETPRSFIRGLVNPQQDSVAMPPPPPRAPQSIVRQRSPTASATLEQPPAPPMGLRHRVQHQAMSGPAVAVAGQRSRRLIPRPAHIRNAAVFVHEVFMMASVLFALLLLMCLAFSSPVQPPLYR